MATDAHTKELSTSLLEITETALGILNSMVMKVEDIKSENKSNGNSNERLITDRMEDLTNQVDKVGEKLIQESQKTTTENEQHLADTLKGLKIKHSKVEDIYSNYSNVLNNGSDLDKILAFIDLESTLDDDLHADGEVTVQSCMFVPGKIDASTVYASFGYFDDECGSDFCLEATLPPVARETNSVAQLIKSTLSFRQPSLPPVNSSTESVRQPQQPTLPLVNRSPVSSRKPSLPPVNRSIESARQPTLPPMNISPVSIRQPPLPPVQRSIESARQLTLPPMNILPVSIRQPPLPPVNRSIESARQPTRPPMNISPVSTPKTGRRKITTTSAQETAPQHLQIGTDPRGQYRSQHGTDPRGQYRSQHGTDLRGQYRYHSQKQGEDPHGQYQSKQYETDPRKKYNPKQHGTDPRQNYNPKQYETDPRQKYNPKHHGTDPRGHSKQHGTDSRRTQSSPQYQIKQFGMDKHGRYQIFEHGHRHYERYPPHGHSTYRLYRVEEDTCSIM